MKRQCISPPHTPSTSSHHTTDPSNTTNYSIHGTADGPVTPPYDRVDLHHPSLSLQSWPADAACRAHVFKLPSESFTSPMSHNCRVVYLPLACLRMAGNASLSMAMWLARSLGVGLDVVTFCEGNVRTEIENAASGLDTQYTRLLKCVSRGEALCALKSRLKDELDIEMRGYWIEKMSEIGAAVLDVYSVQKTDNMKGCRSHIFVVADDALNPALDEVYRQIATGGKELDGFLAPSVEFCVAFDSLSVVPARTLLSAVQVQPSGSDSNICGPNLSGDTFVDSILTGLSRKFDAQCRSHDCAGLLNPETTLSELQLFRDYSRQPSFSSAGFCTCKLASIDWSSICNHLSECRERLSSLSSIGAATGVFRAACSEASADSALLNTLTACCEPDGIQVHTSFPIGQHTSATVCFWDMYTSWAVISPQRIISTSITQISTWENSIRPNLIHIESCRLVYLAKQGQGSLACTGIKASDLMTDKGMSLLCKLVGASNTMSQPYPLQVSKAETEDSIFNAIQQYLLCAGVIPYGIAGKYWMSFLISTCPSAAALLQTAIMEVVRNCIHNVEYSTWPIAYVLSLIESTVNSSCQSRDNDFSIAKYMSLLEDQMATKSGCTRNLLRSKISCFCTGKS
mmetsp:Transcript_7254/g.10790  ORF Transcript_7254/g.10790 Transcript_7254/m.10790 type:complete len:628 (+) Transcript_7254:98-1981(+)